MFEGGEGLTDHILPPQQLFSGAKVHPKAAAAAQPGQGRWPRQHQAVRGPESWPAFPPRGSHSKLSEMRASLIREYLPFISVMQSNYVM